MIRSVAYVVVLWSLLFLSSGCTRTADEPSGEPLTVTLDLSVSLSDADSSRITRTGDADAANDDEKMQTLRIVVVRPDGRVEANRFVKPSSAVLREEASIRVVARERKRIFLFVNEADTRIVRTDGEPVGDGSLLTLLSSIAEGEPFPDAEIASLAIGLEGESSVLTGALPMNESHVVEVGESDAHYDLFVTRAAVKFTFRITNRNDRELRLTGLSIDKMAHRSYYMPHGAVYNDDREIVAYDACPSEYYTYRLVGKDSGAPDIVLPRDKAVELPPLYLLEGKYKPDEDGRCDYSMGLSINGVSLSRHFPALPLLPRNTHVVVGIEIRSESSVSWKVDLTPYDERPLDPVFGQD